MDKCLAKLAGRESKYKYSVTCVLMQKNGAGLVTSSSQYWEKHDADLYVPVPWENNSIHCIVTIFVSETELKTCQWVCVDIFFIEYLQTRLKYRTVRTNTTIADTFFLNFLSLLSY